MHYPIWLGGALAGGVVIGMMAILHVIISHFAIGAGFLIVTAETIGRSRSDEVFVDFAEKNSYLLLLFSVVLGALTGVGIWFTIGLVSPVGTSMLIHNFVWGWAIEWVFFILEIAAALIYYATWRRVSGRTHIRLGWLYFIAAWLSLVIINGIITFMLTPGRWIQTHAFWDGFFNPTYFPSLVFRTALAVAMGTVYGLAVVGRLKAHTPEERRRVSRWLAAIGLGAAIVMLLSVYWWAGKAPEMARDMFASSSGLYYGTWRMSRIAAIVVIALLALVALLPRINIWPVAAVLILAMAVHFGGYERVREASRKPFIIHDYMYSNGIRVEDVDRLNEEGVLSAAPWAWNRKDGTRAEMGEAVWRAQCTACHTIGGYNDIAKLVEGFDYYTLDGLFTVLDQNPAMPPFVGTDEERTALARYVATVGGMPPDDGAAAGEGGPR